MSAARILGVLLPVLLLLFLAGAGVWWAAVRRGPSSSRPEASGDLAWWALLPAEEQEAYDTAVLDLAEQAELDAEYDAREAAEFLAQRAQANALFHP